MNRKEQTLESASAPTGRTFATLRDSLRAQGSSAPSAARLCAIVACAAAFFTLASAASAAPPNFCPFGHAAGQCDNPSAVAVDQSTGTVYIADGNNYRIDVFDQEAHFLRAFGFGVADGANELQTCTTVCIRGLQGSAAGQFSFPRSIAVDPASHDLYVADTGNSRVEKFTPAGQFLLSFGSRGTGPGQFDPDPFLGAFMPLAVDPVTHDVLVGDNERIERFSEAGTFLSETALPGSRVIASLALDTDAASPSFGDFYTVNSPLDEIQRITPPASSTYTLTFEGQTTSPLAFNASDAEITIALQALPAIGPGNVQVLSVAGEQHLVSFQGALADTDVPQLVPSAGSLTTRFQGGPGRLLKFDPSGTLLEALDASGHPNALALDPSSGSLFVGDCQRTPNSSGSREFNGSCTAPYTLLAFNPTGAQTEAFGSGEVLGAPAGNALAFGDAAQRLYVVSNKGEGNSAAQAFALPAPGPLPGAGTTKATEVKKTAATFCAKVNSEGKSTTVHFQYVTAVEYEEDGETFGVGTLETSESAPIGSDFEPHEACLPVSSLEPATEYKLRVVATNENGVVNGETVGFESLPPAAIDSTTVSDVTATSATLQAEINPLGDATSYRFEYLTDAAYLQNEAEELPPFSGAAQAPLSPAAIGAGSTDVAVFQHLQNLAPHTAYRYRTVVLNVVSEANGGPFAGPARVFTTQLPGALPLPDNRAWELVSPPDKHGARLTANTGGALIQASAAGDAIAYLASAPTEAQPPSALHFTRVLSVRGPAGWASRDLGVRYGGPTSVGAQDYNFFSSDLSLGLLQPTGPFDPTLSPAASQPTAYLGTNFPPGNPTALCTTSCYRPLVTACPEVGEPCPPAVEAAANVPPGTVFGDPECYSSGVCGPKFLGATPGLEHVVLFSGASITSPSAGLVEWSADAPPAQSLRPVSVPPSGEPEFKTLYLGHQGARIGHAISADGSRVIFSTGETGHLYLRDLAKEETVKLDAVQGGPGAAQGSNPTFQLASADGSRVFFTDSQQLTADAAGSGRDLYECAMVEEGGELKCDLSDLTPESAGEPAAVQGAVVGASEDGSYLYFVADGVLAHNQGADRSHAVPGLCGTGVGEHQPPGATCNLYLLHDGATSFLATLDGQEEADWYPLLPSQTSRVSPSGRWLAFMSQRPLTGYDSRDAVSGQPNQEVFLYDAAASGGEGKLICASCNPTGARPHGKEFSSLSSLNGGLVGSGKWESSQWLAANVPGSTGNGYQPRYLSDSGRLFFNSSDALVPSDTNGNEDVYEHEPPGVGGCTESTAAFSATSGGCVSLISSGASGEESAFLDASQSGDDVFFLTTSRLSSQDFDTSLDIYDAHVCSAGLPCPPPPPPPTPPCEGDACQLPAVPPNDSTPGSLTFQGAGNVVECPKGKVKKSGKCLARKHKKSHKKHAKKRPASHNRGGSK